MKKIKGFILIVGLALAASITSFATEGWKQDNSGWLYENSNGSYTKNNWQKINGTWYYFDDTGYMKTGWLYLGSSWYYLKQDGAMHSGWLEYNGNWYFLHTDGAMHRGWLEDNGKWYYLHSNGAMAYNTTIDGYYVNATGAWVQTYLNSSNNSGSTSSKYPLQMDYNNSRSYEEIDTLAEQYYNQYEGEIKIFLDELNKIRIKAGANPVKLDKNMSLAATARAIHMVSYNYLGHYYDGINQATLIAERYRFYITGEINSWDTQVVPLDELVSGFKSSSEHYSILCALSHKKVGIGLAPDNGYSLILTIVFSD